MRKLPTTSSRLITWIKTLKHFSYRKARIWTLCFLKRIEIFWKSCSTRAKKFKNQTSVRSSLSIWTKVSQWKIKVTSFRGRLLCNNTSLAVFDNRCTAKGTWEWDRFQLSHRQGDQCNNRANFLNSKASSKSRCRDSSFSRLNKALCRRDLKANSWVDIQINSKSKVNSLSFNSKFQLNINSKFRIRLSSNNNSNRFN